MLERKVYKMSSLVLQVSLKNASSEIGLTLCLLMESPGFYPFLKNVLEIELPHCGYFSHCHAVIKQIEPKNYQWITQELP
tara:strand:- start:40 stop:279 length:240 start_codon:yes stop_codon:yes gene_type:complete